MNATTRYFAVAGNGCARSTIVCTRGESDARCRTRSRRSALRYNISSLSDQSFRKRRLTVRIRLLCFLPFLFLALVALPSFGQNAPSDPQATPSSTPADNTAAQTKPPDPQPLPMPSMSGPLQTALPHELATRRFSSKRPLAGGNSICRAVPTTCRLSECRSSRPQIR